ncbi:unnamed protein product, partial [Rotaria sp. Silwood2]
NLLLNGDETDEEYIENLEYLVYNWKRTLHEEINNELNKRVINSNPLAELEFWHERSIRVTSILEQMQKGIDSSSLGGFNNIKLQFKNFTNG